MLTATLENVLNRGLPRSPRAQQLCAELAGRRVAVAIAGSPRQVLVESTGLSLKLSAVEAGVAADATISGGPFSLLALSGAAPEAVLQRGDVRVDGDAELAQKFRELALLLRPDLEDELSLVVGDVPAHQLGRFARAAFGWTRKAAATTVRNAAEYLAHERRDLVPRSEAEQFLQGVDTLREDVDRLAVRIDLLTRS
ncbi:MAG: ubiquinone biosynthesis accessory factor UbiJ [Gammaproteobacteria bacterium]|jgi:ubiquinone biosynthesis protein UbiJ|nr:ubiquinone biosynthesis accessory factor UbiJ [Gammaproteobacteria bacterium]